MTEALPQRIVPFYGDELIAAQQTDGTIYVLFTRLCENLGLARWSQVRRVQSHDILNEGFELLTIHTEGGTQAVQCLRLDLLPLWMSGLHARRVKPEIQPKLVRYQKEAAVVLWQAFKPQILVEETTVVLADNIALQQLQHIAEMGRAIAHMAEQQIELQREQQALAGRMNSAARVIKDVQGHLASVDVRLGMVEERLTPVTTITDTQATEVSNRAKALAEFMTGKESRKNHYQGIFAELYRRFGVSSYKLIRHDQFTAVLQFLDDWWMSASGSAA